VKKLQALFLISLLAGAPLYAQTHHAGEKTLPPAARQWVEISVAATRSFARLQDRGGNSQLPYQDGLSGRALLIVFPWLSLGAEGTWFEKEKDIPFVSVAKTHRYGAVAKFTLTPDTQPKVYLLAGAGKTKREFAYSFHFSETDTTDYLSLAVGLEAQAWRGIFVAAEGHEMYYAHTLRSDFFQKKHRWEPGLSVRAGVRF